MNRARRTTAAAATTVVLATAGGLCAVTAAPAAAATTCTSPVYKRQIFANTTFSGTPKQTGCDAAISENWGAKAPASGVSSNNFGVRWTVTRDFGSGGPFAFTAAVQDGLRVYVDGVRKVDIWKNGSTTVKKTVNLTLPAGKHTLRVDYVNWTGNANVAFTYAPRTTATVDKVKPLTPTGLAATYDTATGRAKLTWAANKEMDLAGYRIYRRPAESTTWTRLTATASTTYTDTTLPVTGTAYAYELRAYDKAGNESAGTADKTVTTVDRTAPGVPAGLSVSSESGGLRLLWSQVTGAASYGVYRAASADGTYTRIGTGADQVSYLDTTAAEDGTYFYRVTALDAAGNESARSTAVSGKRRDLTPPSAVTGVTVTPTEYGFLVGWDANPTADLASYTVRRGELLGDEGDERVCSLSAGYSVPAGTTSYAYTVLPDGEQSCFVVDAVDDAGNSAFRWTGEAQIVTATELDMTPSVPTPDGSPLSLTVSAAEGDEGNLLTWQGLADSAPEQAGGYLVHRWNPETSAYETIAALPSGTTEFADTSVQRGTTTYYWVTAVAEDGTESLPAGDWTVTAP
ncbi:fibronectin type III domain-containing protein [Streptomyces sp. NPDC088812]|uniref:fibronectin type III domain-containing protein n=1 Tax=Streptomyces sp. NPDC088812 TaxID=3365905 RepID=UPI00381C76B5